MIYPWHTQQWQQLINAFQQNKLAHALLLQGQTGLGQFEFAKQFAHFILCQDPTKTSTLAACNTCKSCQLFLKETNPDLQMIMLEEDSHVIKLDQIKTIINQNSLTSQYNGYKVIIIMPAEKMNTAAANALLKTLEEPQGTLTLFMLISESVMRLSATIRSRCQQIVFHAPSLNDTKTWLASKDNNFTESNFEFAYYYCQAAPIMISNFLSSDEFTIIKQLFDSFIQIATTTQFKLGEITKQFTKVAIIDVLRCLQLALVHLLKVLHINVARRSEASPGKMLQLRTEINKVKLHALLDEIALQKNALLQGVSLNNQLVLEQCLIQLKGL